MAKMKINNLKDKGWSKKEITKTQRMLARGDLKRSRILYHFSFLSAGIAFITGQILASISVIPAFLLLEGASFNIFVLLLGLTFGIIFVMLFESFKHKISHKIIALISTLVVLSLNMYFITLLSNNLAFLFFNTYNNHNPVSVSITYTISFLLPYILTRAYQKL